MTRKGIIILAIALTTAIFFAGCELSASDSIPEVATPNTSGSNPTSQTSIPLVQQWATTTAIYLQTASPQQQANTTQTPEPSHTTTPASTANLTIVPPTGSAITPTTTTTQIVAVTVTPGRPASYTLKQGEFPYCIARRFNVDQKALLAANNLTDAQAGDLPVGTTLIIPQNISAYIGTRYWHPHPATFIVGSTSPTISTIYGVACYYGDIDPSVIAAANGLSLTSPLAIGRTLNIP